MLHYFNTLLINLRDLYKYQTKQIILVEKNNEIIKSSTITWLVQLCSFLNYNFYDYNYLFLMDEMYFYHTKNKPQKMIKFSVINNCYIKSQPIRIDITENILKYNLQVPMYLILENENIQEFETIEFNILKLGKKINKEYSIKEIKYKNLGEII